MDHRTAMAYAVREGARVGASASATVGSNPAGVDPAIIAAVQRGLTDPILIEDIASIEIFKADPARPADDRQDQQVRPGRHPRRHGRLAGQQRGCRAWDQRRLDRHQGPLRLSSRDAAAVLLGVFFGGRPPYTTMPMTDATVIHLEPAP